jgi:hypothetical protein
MQFESFIGIIGISGTLAIMIHHGNINNVNRTKSFMLTNAQEEHLPTKKLAAIVIDAVVALDAYDYVIIIGNLIERYR